MVEDVGGGFGGLSDTKRSTAVARMWSNTRCHVDADSKQGVTSPLQTHTPRTCNDCQRCPEAYVCIEKFPFSHHFKVLEILPDVVLGLTWLQSYNLIVNWEERYADVRHPSTSYKLSWMDPKNPHDYTCMQLQNQVSFRHFQPVPRRLPQLKALKQLSPSTWICTYRDITRVRPMPRTTSARKLESLMSSAVTSKSSTSRCPSLNKKSIDLISRVTGCIHAACLDRQCRSTTSTACKARKMMATDLIRFDKDCQPKYTNGRVSTTGNKLSLRNYLQIDLDDSIEYTLTQTTTLRGWTLIKWTQANWMSFDRN